MEHNDMLLAGDAARLLGISYSRIQQLVRRGRLRPAARTPKGIRIFELAEVQRLRDERERQRNTVSV